MLRNSYKPAVLYIWNLGLFNETFNVLNESKLYKSKKNPQKSWLIPWT